jgi:uncharacterized protein (TIGR02599 family)
MKTPRRFSSNSKAMTLVEVLVSMAVIVMLLLMLVQMTDSVGKTWQSSMSRIAEFREAREGFESMNRHLAQATLNTYWDYDNATAPTKYMRQSELRFLSGPPSKIGMDNADIHPSHAIFFQAPLGYVENQASYARLNNLLNTWGYFIEWGSDADYRPDFITPTVAPLRWRFRLIEMMEPSEKLSVYAKDLKDPSYSADLTWFNGPLKFKSKDTPPTTFKRVLAENILAVVFLPQRSNVENNNSFRSLVGDNSFDYNSAIDSSAVPGRGIAKSDSSINQLPPLVRVMMIALDENSFSRYQFSRGGGQITMPTWLDGKFLASIKNDDDVDALLGNPTKNIVGELEKEHITYRKFTTVLPIKGAKWSAN